MGGNAKQKQLYCRPMGKGRVEVSETFKRLGVLPIYGSESEAAAQNIWFRKALVTTKWRRGEFDETETLKKGAKELKNGLPVRGAKKCNNKLTHSCINNKHSISFWSGFLSGVSGPRAIVRDKRSNTRTQKILWAGTHIPGQGGVPANCALSNAWNFYCGSEEEVSAICAVLNSPIADMALRSIGSKRNINPKDLNLLGLPPIGKKSIMLLNSAETFSEKTAVVFLSVFELQPNEIALILADCMWLNERERQEISKLCQLDLDKEILELAKSRSREKKKQPTTSSRKLE